MKLPSLKIPLFGKGLPIIDVHAHTFFGNADMQGIARSNGATFTIEGLKKECAHNGVLAACGIHNDLAKATPIDAAAIAEQQKIMPALIGVGIINPAKAGKDALADTEKAISDGTLRALKIYPGYYPVFCTDKAFHPFYKLAAKYSIPVYVHAGDMIGEGARLKYARPLPVDEIAVDFPDTNFIITQMGNPWFIDTAEVVYKNPNVYTDTAGLFSGIVSYSSLYSQRIQYAIDYIDNPRKILYGSDWPMVRMEAYLRFMRGVIPKELHANVFYENAKRLFRL